MSVRAETVTVSSRGHTDVIDITKQASQCVERSGCRAGIAILFVSGSTAGITTVEYEPGLVKDLRIAYEKIAPEKGGYHHHDTWGDDNGSAHVRASMLGPSLTVPFVDGKLHLGTWQQIVLIDFDTRPRKREILVQILGE